MTPFPPPLDVLDSSAEKALEGCTPPPSTEDASLKKKKKLDKRLAYHVRASCWIARLAIIIFHFSYLGSLPSLPEISTFPACSLGQSLRTSLQDFQQVLQLSCQCRSRSLSLLSFSLHRLHLKTQLQCLHGESDPALHRLEGVVDSTVLDHPAPLFSAPRCGRGCASRGRPLPLASRGSSRARPQPPPKRHGSIDIERTNTQRQSTSVCLGRGGKILSLSATCFVDLPGTRLCLSPSELQPPSYRCSTRLSLSFGHLCKQKCGVAPSAAARGPALVDTAQTASPVPVSSTLSLYPGVSSLLWYQEVINAACQSLRATVRWSSSFLHERGRGHEPQGFHVVQQQVSRSCLFLKRSDNLFHCFCAVDSSSDLGVCVTSHHWQDSVWPLSIMEPTHFITSALAAVWVLIFSLSARRRRVEAYQSEVSSSSSAQSDCSSDRDSVWCRSNFFHQFLFRQSSTQDDPTTSTSTGASTP